MGEEEEILLKEAQGAESMTSQQIESLQVWLKFVGTILRIVGFAGFGILLGLIILFSVLGLGFIAELSWGLFIAVFVIGIGTVMERIV
jgi:hypothetical protein